MSEWATVKIRQRELIIESLFNNECVNDGEYDAFVFWIIYKELLVNLLDCLPELVETKVRPKEQLIHQIWNIHWVIIHLNAQKNYKTFFIKGSIQTKSV